VSYAIANANLPAALYEVLPSLTSWSRLEVHPTTADLAPGLRAEIADPLWLLHRQHAFGEDQGEDAGSPVQVTLAAERARIERFHPGALGGQAASRAVDYTDLQLPLEVEVEREPVEGQRRLVAAVGQQFVRALAAEGAGDMAARFIEEYPLAMPVPDDPVADRDGTDWAAVLAGRVLDADALAAALPRDGDGAVSGLPPHPSVPQARQAAVLRALSRWAVSYDGFLSTPPEDEAPAWLPNRLEYALALSGRLSDGRVVLSADEYTDGHLDWWAFTAASTPSLGDPAVPLEPEPMEPPATLPTAVRYPGMPADRYWELEDGTVNLGSLEAGPTDLGRILLAEYALVFGNDWFVVPLDVPVGSIVKVRDLRVLDTFGVETTVPASHNPSGAPAWEMFELSTAPGAPQRLNDLFFFPPTLPRRLEGDPVEEVRLFRDEMANLAWAVEHRVPGTSGQPMDRSLEAARAAVHQRLDADPGNTQLIYRLQTQVPLHWIPFAPVASAPVADPNFDIQFERRVLLRTLPDGTIDSVHPRGLLLRSDPSADVASEPPLRVEDEEIPRAGAIVTRAYEYTRWYGGTSFLWMGRTKRTGRGEGASALRYDATDPRT
jgi:hypothetical protein